MIIIIIYSTFGYLRSDLVYLRPFDRCGRQAMTGLN